MTKSTALPVNLLDNPKFKEFIDAFTQIAKASETYDEEAKIAWINEIGKLLKEIVK